jgi:hypothetical protein
VQRPSGEDAHERFHDENRQSQGAGRGQPQGEVSAHSSVESPEHAGTLR